MITQKELQEINKLVSLRDDLELIERHLDSPYVEITVGLVEVNSASKMDVKLSDDASTIHRYFPDVEEALKNHFRALLASKIQELNKKVSKYIAD